MKDKYKDYMTINHIQVLKPEEICSKILIEEKHKSSKLYPIISEIVRAFTAVCERYEYDAEQLYEFKTLSAEDESLRFDLRVEIGAAFQSIKRLGKIEDFIDYTVCYICLRYITSIYILIPDIVTLHDKDEIFQYAVDNHFI